MAWYDSDWKHRLKVTIPHAQFTENLSDFTAPILGERITTNKFWYGVLSDGADIVVTLEDGTTKLYRELESIDTTAKTMELYVRVPVLSYTEDTVLYIYFGNSAGAETNDADTWNANYKAVYHMNDDPDNTAIADSTSNGNDGTKKGAGTPAEAAGAFSSDLAQDYTRLNSEYINVADDVSFDITTNITVSALVYVDNVGAARQAFVSKYNVAGNKREWSLQQTNNAGKLGAVFGDPADGTYEGTWESSAVVLSSATWHHVVFTFNNGTCKLYVDGALKGGAGTVPATLYNADAPVGIGADQGANYLGGLISEARITSNDLSAAWLLAEYNSLLNNASFLSVEYDTAYWKTLPTTAGIEYKIEVRDNNGIQQGIFKDIAEATLDQSCNNPAVLNVTCPMNTQISNLLPYLIRPYEIWVLRDGDPIFTGPLNLRDDAHRETSSVHLDVMDYLQSLKQEYVETYDASDDIDGHVDSILAMQVNTRPVMKGTIEPTLTRDLTVEQAYIYETLMNIRNLNVGGYIQVDWQRKLNWYNQLSESTGQQLRYRKNMTGITRTFDWLNFGNKLFIYGDGIDLTDAGYATTYIEDADSIAQYGYCVRKYIEPLSTVAKPNVLLDYAYYKLKQASQPKMSYQVDIVNLAQYGRTFEDLSLGSWIRLTDEELDIDLNVQIVRVVYDLVQPQNIQIELSASPSSIIDFDIGAYY